ncbi:MAG: hypothetical protein QW404_00405 [Candidatus Nanoarchaeia archaeon]
MKMKKTLALVFGVFIISLAVVSAVPVCTDSDNTAADPIKSYQVWGYAHKVFTVFDYCKNGPGTDILKEAYCNGNTVAYQEVSCSTTFGNDYKCIFGKCTEFVWCRFDEQNPNICDSLPAEKKDKCIEVLNEHECERPIPQEICTWIGGTAYDSQEQCEGEPQVPEFSGIAAGLALAGAAVGFMVLRKR